VLTLRSLWQGVEPALDRRHAEASAVGDQPRPKSCADEFEQFTVAYAFS
jgi:hypothetical protein